ncbi:hypothetical protein DFH11DRAFT_759195 [Phellopilus nigrolimitatus]|nr:hypothetical protein DFH11DRAFT_759195 [Phellopilus nigrolimitatus]
MIQHKTRLFLFFCATVMSVLPTISIQNPALSTLDLFRVNLNSSAASNIGEVRFGVWSFCLHRTSLVGEICDTFSPCNLTGTLRLCSEQRYGYGLTLSATAGSEKPGSKSVTPAWTRALASHAAVSIMMVICFILLCFNSANPLVYAFAIFVAFISFLCDIAFNYHLKSVTSSLVNLGIGKNYKPGPGFALQIISGIWLLFEFFWSLKMKRMKITLRDLSCPFPSALLPLWSCRLDPMTQSRCVSSFFHQDFRLPMRSALRTLSPSP